MDGVAKSSVEQFKLKVNGSPSVKQSIVMGPCEPEENAELMNSTKKASISKSPQLARVSADGHGGDKEISCSSSLEKPVWTSQLDRGLVLEGA